LDELFRFPESVKREPAIDAWLNGRTPELGAIARKWFDYMRKRGKDIRELMHDGCPTACADEVAFAYVGVYKAHVNVGFFFGSKLPDPKGLLIGTGKRMRHVKLRPGEELDVAALSTLIDTAYADIKSRMKGA
jgi:hypothetical protein